MSSPDEAGFNGLLGIGQAANDEPNLFSDYFECLSGNCTALDSPPRGDIVLNAVTLFPVDNNGVVVSLPAIPAGGAPSVTGTLYFGIGTESNNQPGAVTVLQQDPNPADDDFLVINTVYGGESQPSYFDTGSNGIFFNSNSTLPNCTVSSVGAGFYCPTFPTMESATNESIGTSASSVVNFNIENAQTLFQSGNLAFDDVGGPFDESPTYDGFDWGLPFFFGRTVYLGIQGTSSSLGEGPLTAY
jgi:hypothetical protein